MVRPWNEGVHFKELRFSFRQVPLWNFSPLPTKSECSPDKFKWGKFHLAPYPRRGMIISLLITISFSVRLNHFNDLRILWWVKTIHGEIYQPWLIKMPPTPPKPLAWHSKVSSNHFRNFIFPPQNPPCNIRVSPLPQHVEQSFSPLTSQTQISKEALMIRPIQMCKPLT